MKKYSNRRHRETQEEVENSKHETRGKNIRFISEKVAVFFRMQRAKDSRPAPVCCGKCLKYRLSFIMMIVYRQYNKDNRSEPGIRVKYQERAEI
jgi:hypothetical protein